MAVDQKEFLGTVEGEAGLSRQEAERDVDATLQTLAERISRGEAQDIALELPLELRGPLLSGGEDPVSFPVDEFVRRVAVRERVSEDVATKHARAVFAALTLHVSPKEIQDMVAQLSSDYADLLPAAAR
jgi:uncharacterized protein (DUF2267 family)